MFWLEVANGEGLWHIAFKYLRKNLSGQVLPILVSMKD